MTRETQTLLTSFDSRAFQQSAVESVWVFPTGAMHPAWVDENTPAITAIAVFLKHMDDTIWKIEPTEVVIVDQKYPALGFSVESGATTDTELFDGRIVKAQQITEIANALPQSIVEIEESDPLQEGAVSQYKLQFASGVILSVKNIMPPLTLGLSVEFPG